VSLGVPHRRPATRWYASHRAPTTTGGTVTTTYLDGTALAELGRLHGTDTRLSKVYRGTGERIRT